MIDLAALSIAVWDRLYSDTDGADVRSALGAGAGSVLMAEDLRVEGLTIQQLPARPIIAFRRGAAPTIDRVVSRPTYTWFAYDDISSGYGVIEQLPKLIADSYASGLTIGTVAVGDIEISVLGQLRNSAPALLLIPIMVSVGAV